MIKNWIVNTKQVKNKETGFTNMINYLKDENRVSHSQTKIRILNESSKEILNEIDKRRIYRQKNSLRGGGIKNYATSFVLSLPRDIKQPTEQQWLLIVNEAVEAIAKVNDINLQKLQRLSHAVLHDESKSLNKSSHVHLVVSNVIDHEVVKGISQFKSTLAIKNSFNYSVKRLLNEDNRDYQPKRKNVKNKPQWLIRAIKQAKTIELWCNFQNSFKEWIETLSSDRKKATFLSKKVAHEFNKLDEIAPTKLSERAFEELKKTENTKLPEKLRSDNGIEVFEAVNEISASQKVTPKTNRKRRRRRPT